MLSESSVSLSVTVTVRVMLEPSPSSPLYSPMTTSIASPSSCCNWRIVRLELPCGVITMRLLRGCLTLPLETLWHFTCTLSGALGNALTCCCQPLAIS
ncbi:hypothetical protein L211DRAFT_99118 [Terfezia boudieri ATCC MYA-4762]|uniref:Uncharacterized protein n=1 Tax=Terfezia boudieri ATCC MYA-4762 TaxID=1051890 RepID=A0A3N4L633_9PEZI|nr:hypothetical protein L211DRAFT_99118 [Terfezia boudieri ATCC MYA-4762]